MEILSLTKQKMIIVVGSLFALIFIIIGTLNNLVYIGVFILLLILSLLLFFLWRNWSLDQILIYTVFPILLMYQFFFPVITTIDIPLSYLFLLLFFVISTIKFKIFRWIGTQPLLFLYILFIFTLLVSLIYSPEKYYGIRIILYETVGLVAIIFSFYVREKEINIDNMLRYILLFGSPIAFFNIVFFLYPNFELDYLKSFVARLIIEPNRVLGLFTDLNKNNILDPMKSGTVFVNTNPASVFYLVLFWISFIYYITKNEVKYLSLSILYLLALLATYSRTGYIAFFVTFILFIISINKNTFRKRILPFGLLIIFLGVFAVSSGIFSIIVDRFRMDIIYNDPRLLIWAFALQLFLQNPLLGVGFGGWEKVYPNYAYMVGIDTGFPPHNIFIQLWTWSGLLGLFIFILLLSYPIIKSIKLIKSDYRYYIIVLSFITVIIQGMTENFYLTDYRISTLLFFITGLLLYKNPNQLKREEG